MKKKIRELSKEETDNICSKNLTKYKNCDNCPFLFQDNYCIKDSLEREIEVDEIY